MLGSPFLAMHPRTLLAALCASAILSVSSAVAVPSFECSTNLPMAQVTVCADRALSALDVQLDDIYQRLLARVSRADADAIRAERRDWVRRRDDCDIDKACLRHVYQNAIDRLQGKLDDAPAAPARPVAPTARGPSFECSTTAPMDEVTICADRSLAALDRQLDDLYQRTLAAVTRSEANSIRDDQRAWLKRRQDCDIDKACIRAAYQTRIDALQSELRDASR
jgi:uncharacterized protein